MKQVGQVFLKAVKLVGGALLLALVLVLRVAVKPVTAGADGLYLVAEKLLKG